MVRAASTDLKAALAGDQPKFVLIELEEDESTFQRYAFAPIDLTWDGKTWLAITVPIQVTEIRETDSGEATGMQVTFLNVNESVISEALTNSIRLKPVRVWLGAINDSHQIVANPMQVFAGYGDAIKIQFGLDRASVTWSIESYEARWNSTAGGRMTDAEHQARYPGDKFFSMIAKAAEDTTLVWPAKSYWRGD